MCNGQEGTLPIAWLRPSRCVKDRKECVFLEAKPRPKRVRTSRAYVKPSRYPFGFLTWVGYFRRVAEMEQRLDGLFAMLSANSRNVPIKDIKVTDVPYPMPSTPSDQIESAMIPQPRSAMNSIPPLTPITATSYSWPKFDESQDVIGKGIICYDKAETLLRSYGTHAYNFPFIVLSATASLDSLRREKPFLLLSILTVASSSNLPLQDLLEAELRQTLSRKVIFDGQKSLDLLQGLLIYLTW